MTYQMNHKNIIREFDFFPPFAWQYWHQRVFDEDGRNGLPLIIALHGGGQDPGQFQLDWPFPALANSPDEDNWQDRCLVLYPYGNSYFSLNGVPVRGWNPGFTGEYMPPHSDVGFIRAAITEVEKMMQRDLRKLGVNRPAIDRDRCFVFGYSMGGMMAYKLAHEVADYFAALWVMSGAYGGRSHEGLTSTVLNNPRGSSSVSLFAHHGDVDTVVPPGARTVASGRVQPTDPDFYAAFGVPGAAALDYKPSFRTLAAAVDTFTLYNNCEQQPFEINRPPADGAADINGTDEGVKVAFRQPGGAVNPEVIVHRDPHMGHTDFLANRYYQAGDVWDFFKEHPRVSI